MKQLGKLVLLTLGMGLMAAALGQMSTHDAQADAVKPVRVVNTPLPITGNVNVTNNPLSVSFNGMAQPVIVANTTASPALVRAVDGPARQPFQASVAVNIADGSFFSGEVSGFTVPAGKRLILETATFDTQLPSPQQVIAPEVRLNGWGHTRGISSCCADGGDHPGRGQRPDAERNPLLRQSTCKLFRG